MSGTFLFYLLTFVPFSNAGLDAGQYNNALTTAREAAFIQSGIKADYEQVRSGAERAIEKAMPPAVKQAIAVGGIIHRREVLVHTKASGPIGAATWTVRPNYIHVGMGWSW